MQYIIMVLCSITILVNISIHDVFIICICNITFNVMSFKEYFIEKNVLTHTNILKKKNKDKRVLYMLVFFKS